jgi:septal ring factor EnvC (AmiA/AmiB activator)
LIIFVATPYPESISMRYISIVIILIFISSTAIGQSTRADLEKRRQAIVESLKETQAQLEATKKDKKATMSQLNALQAKLNAREKLINNINQEMNNLDNDIKTSADEVQTLRKNLKIQQLRYAQSVRYAYANRSSYNTLAFIFSAKDFNDAMRRMKYMKKYREFRKSQVDEIKSTQNKIVEKINVLSTVKNQKGQLLTAEEQQKMVLQQERNETTKIVEELKGREKDLMADIENKRKITKRLDNAIGEAIRREIEIARKKAEEEERKATAARNAANANRTTTTTTTNSNVIRTNNATNSGANRSSGTGNYNPVANTVDRSASTNRTKTTYTPSLTPEVAELSKGFESNRGRLPWPVASGVVIDQFGKHKHAVATKVEIDNSGIDIQTSQGAKARAIFDGVVTKVWSIAGLGYTVLISHGKYFSVYSGLSAANIKAGDNVSTKQIIGTVGNNEDGVAVMNFQVWRGAEKMNPSMWIAPM